MDGGGWMEKWVDRWMDRRIDGGGWGVGLL